MKYRKKPVVIEAIQIIDGSEFRSDFLRPYLEDGTIFETGNKADPLYPVINEVKIKTLEGDLKISEGDYIIKGVKGEIYPCKPDIFKATYEKEESTWQDRLRKETKELSEKVNKLHTYMATDKFYQLPREDKDLLYKQEKFMMGYLQILGKRCELHGVDLNED